MICPKCYGTGWWITWELELPNFEVCSYPGCHGGHVHCCDGDVEVDTCPKEQDTEVSQTEDGDS